MEEVMTTLDTKYTDDTMSKEKSIACKSGANHWTEAGRTVQTLDYRCQSTVQKQSDQSGHKGQ